MNYILERIVVGPLEVNCYILACRKTFEAIIIDPGAEGDRIIGRLVKNKLSPKYVINTHGHGDHIGADAAFGVPVLIHKADAEFLNSPEKNLSLMFMAPISVSPRIKLLEDGAKIKIGDIVLEAMHTPGHTPGSLSLKYEDLLFTGDALFRESIGRTDLPYGSQAALLESIHKKLLVLPDSTKIYPGHGPFSTIGHEKKHNPFLL